MTALARIVALGRSLRGRLLIALIFVGIVPLAALGAWIDHYGGRVLMRRTVHELSTVAAFKSQRLDDWVKARQADIQRPTSIPRNHPIVAALVTGRGPAESVPGAIELREVLEGGRRTQGFTDLSMLDARDGLVVLSTDPEQEGKYKDDRPYFREGRKGLFTQRAYYSLVLGKPVMAFAAPFVDSTGTPVAVLVGRADLRVLDRVMAERTGLGRTGRSFVVNRFNYFVSDTLGRGPLGWRPVFSEGVNRAVAGHTGSDTYLSHDGRRVIGAYRWLPDLGLGLVVEMDEDEALASVRRLRVALIGTLGIVAMLAIGIGALFAYEIGRPLSRLVRAVRSIGAGDLDHRVSGVDTEELATLASAMNRMADDLLVSRRALEGYSQTLEARVAERTAESDARRQAAEALAEVGRALTQSLDVAIVSERITDRIRSLLSLNLAILYRLEAATGDLIAVSKAAPDAAALVGRVDHVPAGTGTIGRAVQERVPVVTTDLLGDPRITLTPGQRERLAGLTNRAVLAVPLLVQDRVIGALSLSDETGRVFTDEEIRLAQAFADQAAIAFQNAMLVADLKVREARLSRLLETSHHLSALRPLDEVLANIAEACGHLLGTDSVGFRIVEGDELVVRATSGDAREAMPKSRLKLNESLSGLVATSGEPLIVQDIVNDLRVIPEHLDAVRRLGHRAWLGMPVKVGDRVVGVLSIRTRREQGFTDEDRVTAMAFASQAAVALENARLYEESRRAYEELARTQDQLVQSQKMEAIGRLAGGIAHDFNNLLTIINGRSQLLLRKLAPNDPMFRNVSLIGRTGERAAQLTRKLLAFSRKQVLQPEVLDLNTVVSETAAMLRRLIGEDIQLNLQLGQPLGWVNADPSQLEQILMNLAVNARDAMPEGGTLTVRTADIEPDRRVLGKRGLAPGRYVVLEVTDTGHGMDAETKRRSFEPFFTTKPQGQGTGLGLSTVYGIVQQSGGFITVESEPGRGATFKVHLPRVDEPVPASSPTPAIPRALGGAETVLLVEDEDEVRALAREALETHGYTVLEARDGDEAIRVSESYAGPIHLLLSDVIMPGLRGPEVARRIGQQRSTMKVLLMSGYTDEAVFSRGSLDRKMSYLEKPFTPDELVGAVRSALDTRQNGPHTNHAPAAADA